MAEDFVTWLTALSEEGGAVWAIVLVALAVLVALPVLAAFGFISRRALDRAPDARADEGVSRAGSERAGAGVNGSGGGLAGAADAPEVRDATGGRSQVGAGVPPSRDGLRSPVRYRSALIEVECAGGSVCRAGSVSASELLRSGSGLRGAEPDEERATTMVVRQNNDAETRKLGQRGSGSGGRTSQKQGGEPDKPVVATGPVSGGSDRLQIAFPDTGSLRIGRESDNDIVLSDPTVHRYHAYIRRTPELTYEIHDLSGQTGNGLRIGGERTASAVLSDGDVVVMGQSRLRFRAG